LFSELASENSELLASLESVWKKILSTSLLIPIVTGLKQILATRKTCKFKTINQNQQATAYIYKSMSIHKMLFLMFEKTSDPLMWHNTAVINTVVRTTLHSTCKVKNKKIKNKNKKIKIHK
jgi:hypothetical protein